MNPKLSRLEHITTPHVNLLDSHPTYNAQQACEFCHANCINKNIQIKSTYWQPWALPVNIGETLNVTGKEFRVLKLKQSDKANLNCKRFYNGLVMGIYNLKLNLYNKTFTTKNKLPIPTNLGMGNLS
jgi:hypothetical protein